MLTCGGFENNQEMIRNYLPGVPYCYTSGTPYNEGDGITMAMSVGADLWHMNNYAGPSMALKVPEIRTTFSMQALHFSKQMPGGMIVVGPDARRFTDEKFKTRHGKMPVNGRWLPLSTPCPMFMIFDHTLFSAGPLYDKHPSHGWTQIIERYEWSEDNSAELAKGWIKTRRQPRRRSPRCWGSTPPRWPTPSAAGTAPAMPGTTPEFGRTLMLDADRRRAVLRGRAVALDAQHARRPAAQREGRRSCGPTARRSRRLYSAGELGSIYSYLYQGTGNIGECLAFGRIAGRNAAAEAAWGVERGRYIHLRPQGENGGSQGRELPDAPADRDDEARDQHLLAGADAARALWPRPGAALWRGGDPRLSRHRLGARRLSRSRRARGGGDRAADRRRRAAEPRRSRTPPSSTSPA